MRPRYPAAAGNDSCRPHARLLAEEGRRRGSQHRHSLRLRLLRFRSASSSLPAPRSRPSRSHSAALRLHPASSATRACKAFTVVARHSTAASVALLFPLPLAAARRISPRQSPHRSAAQPPRPPTNAVHCQLHPAALSSRA